MRKKITLALLSLLLVPLGMMAQEVTVRPDNGSMLPAKKFTDNSGGDIFFRWRGFATWKHEQLSLTMTTGDSDNNLTNAGNQLTSNGQLQNPANNIFATPADPDNPGAARYLQIGKGGQTSVMNTYLTVVLPKGYRFTGYTITFHRIPYPTADGITYVEDDDQIQWTNDDGDYEYSDLVANGGSISFGETDRSFTYRSGNYINGITTADEEEHTITRTSSDMTNVLYFKLSSESAGRAFIQLDHMELQFTAENNTPTLVPPTVVTNRSAVDIPFTTGKVDYDELTDRTDGVTRISYNGTIRDMNANMILYEKGSVKTITAAQNDFDGTAGDVVDYKQGSISQIGDYFKLDPSTHNQLTADGEAIYYIESPIWATNSAAEDAHKNPIGYRIVGATFNYGAGTGNNVYFPRTFKIQYNSTYNGPNENGTYGLNVYSGTYNWNPSYHTVWRMDQNGYIYGYGDGDIYYLAVTVSGSSVSISMTTTKPTNTYSQFTINNNQIRTKSRINGSYYYIGWKEVRATDNYDRFITYVDDNGDTNYRVTRSLVMTASASGNYNSTTRIGISNYVQQSAASTTALGGYTLKIYKPNGVDVEKTIHVTNQSGSETVSGYNNDAIKIGIISDATNGGPGLINAKITMQALDPYIDRMDIVCKENNGNGGQLTQQFSATDFSVRGGQFTFYVPQGFPAPAKFTFENLYSSYGDDSYPDGKSTNHARYFFVQSPYHQTAANVYSRSESASYTTKVKTEKVGSSKFTFNNAATVSEDGGQFEEYAFNPSNYSSFIDFTFNQTEMQNGTTKTAYLFTSDETRYNIAPTTGTQHVFYAFYEMTIDMETKTYQPTLTWNKLYDKTFYSANNKDIMRDSKWGLELNTTETIDDHGTHSGYLTVTQIKDAIADALEPTAEEVAAHIPAEGQTASTEDIAKYDYDGDNDIDKDDVAAANSHLTKSDQILYVDGSKLMNIVENQTSTTSGGSTTYTSHPKSELKAVLDKNALIYLPYGSKSSDDNFAYNTIEDYTKTPIFRGAKDIVILDRYPFYAPYDIQVDAEKMAKYDRTVTNQDLYGDDDQHLTIVLPFEIDVTDGVHTGEGSSFSLATMNQTNSLAKNADDPIDYYADAYFTPIQGEHSEANTPYVVTMQGTAVEGSFKVYQESALVKATPNTTGIMTGETASGTYTYEGGKDDYSFTHKGTYTGIEIGDEKAGGAAAASTKVFYFANNFFLDSKTLANNKSLKMLPFRSYYEYAGGAKAKMMGFRVVFGENEDDNTTGINEVKRNSNLAIIPGNGYITIMAKADSNVAIHTVNGMKLEKCNLRAGETRTVAMPSGIYVINGVKMIVK